MKEKRLSDDERIEEGKSKRESELRQFKGVLKIDYST